MVSDLPYRKGLTKEQALKILIQNSGTQFDPIIIDVFIRLSDTGQLA